MRSLHVVDMTWLLPMTGAAGAALGLVAGRAGRRTAPQTPLPSDPAEPTADVAELLRVLRSSAVILDQGDAVRVASPTARALGLVRGVDLVHGELKALARAARADGVIRESQLELARGPLGGGVLSVLARVAPLADGRVLLLVDDQTQLQRVEAVRRDFVANVSHELKTPVGGIALLSEAVEDASDDPEAVRRFAKRIRVESERLSQLVQEIVDLSRLQADDSLSDPHPVDVADVVHLAAARIETLAQAKRMQVALAAEPGSWVFGDEHMLGTAVDNLLRNAVNYSGPDTRIGVGVRQVDGMVEITVADQGVGIRAEELDRIFERFYRVDPARSRATGGTGLGLAIVKHIAVNHGGEVKVWSEEGQGSTFTMRLPAADELHERVPGESPARQDESRATGREVHR